MYPPNEIELPDDHSTVAASPAAKGFGGNLPRLTEASLLNKTRRPNIIETQQIACTHEQVRTPYETLAPPLP